MRLIAERLLPEQMAGRTFIRGELSHWELMLPRPASGFHHIYCSPHNAGAVELMREVADSLRSPIEVATEPDALTACQSMLVYLDGRTWTSGMASTALAAEVARAMSAGVPLLLAHEMPGIEADGSTRHPVEFGTFFSPGATPHDLIEAGIYSTIAIPLKGGVFRKVSLAMVAQSLGARATGGCFACVGLPSMPRRFSLRPTTWWRRPMAKKEYMPNAMLESPGPRDVAGLASMKV